jgi:hypothetical protein
MGPVTPPAALAASGRLRPEHGLDVRDAISAFVGKRFIGTQDQDARALYSMLRARLGGDTASKLLTHLSLFNQRPDMLQATPEQRVQAFYDIGSNDPELNTLISRSKMMGQGPISGMAESPLVDNRELLGQKWYTKANPQAPASLQNIQRAAASIR